MKPKNIILLIVAAVIITFLAQNSEQTAIKFLFWRSGSLPRWLLLGGLLVVGFLSGWVFSALRGRKKLKRELPPEDAAVEKGAAAQDSKE